jgi:DNA-binding transcriptional ArsR family regulator
MRILLSLAGHELTPGEISSRLPDVAHATLYRHIGKLEKAGVLVVVDENQKRGVTERTYALADTQQLNLSVSFQEATDDDRFGYFLSFVTSLLQDFALYLRSREGESKGDFGFHSHVINLNDREFAQLAAKLNELFKPYLDNKLSNKRTPRTLSTIIIPRLAE